MDPLLARYYELCNNAVLPGQRWRFLIGKTPVGWVLPALAAELAEFHQIAVDAGGDDPAAVRLNPESAGDLQIIARALSERGRFRWRGEAFDVWQEPSGTDCAKGGPRGMPLGRIDRGALPVFGMWAHGVHVNGLVRRGDETLLWVARRAAGKSLDPGKLDHIVAGGVPAGLTPAETLVKEAAEEAAIPAGIANRSVAVETIAYAMERPEGLRRDLLHCYDLYLPADFVPKAADGEVESFELWPVTQVLETVRRTDAFKFNVNLVLIGLFRRLGLA